MLSLLSYLAFADNSSILESRNISRTKVTNLKSEPKARNDVSIKPLDLIVAFVNKGVITSSQLNNEINFMRNSYKQKGIAVKDNAAFRNNVLNQMITLKVQLDLAKRLGIQTSDMEISTAINNIAKSQGLTLDQFKAKLARGGVSYEDFQRQARDQIIAEKLKQREVDARIMVTDDEIKRILSSEAYKKRIDYNLSYIIVSVPEHSSQDIIQSKQKLANEAYQALKNSQSFRDVSAKYSNAPNALEGGSLGWKSNVALPGIISNALASLSKGDITQVIQLPMGFLIFKINDIKKLGTPQIIRQYHVRHILIKVGENNSDSEAHQKIVMIKDMLDKYKNDPKQESKEFTKLAKRYSEDASSINGGDIGWVSNGDTVPEFENTIIKTPIGQISKPIKTPFGWHILQVEGVRDADKTNDVVKASIRQEIREVKAALLYTEWIRNIRDAAYVKINEN